MPAHDYDVIVVGGGHAGAEAAWAAARLGARTALLTFSRTAIGRPSCNPAIGGIGKGQMVREIDALGGLMGLVTDAAGIQFRMLNRSKGPAVWAPRAQIDSQDYPATLRHYLETCPNLEILEASVEALRTAAPTTDRYAHRIAGVTLAHQRTLSASAVVITSGTFLRGLMHTGPEQTCGGRIGEPAASGLSASLENLGFALGRLKTGTPPRVARDSVDLAALATQPGDAVPAPFSFLHDAVPQEQVCCWLTSTTPAIHEQIRANLHRAPMFSGQIHSRGPRYCPSIEDKVVRFADKTSHQVFLEPEGRASDRLYVNGISTSLPRDVQARVVAGIPGLQHARIVQWGYAVEYDFVPPEQIDLGLMTRRVQGLFLAGQINGTSGYEEAAAQGLLAGINAARYCAAQPALVLGRDEAYIGVMVDDLVTRGVTEPYRMFTSRAEHRLHLRYDNADERLTPIGRKVGLVDEARWRKFEGRQSRCAELRALFRKLRFEGRRLEDWLRRPEEDGARFVPHFPELGPLCQELDTWTRALVAIKYEGYLEREKRVIDSTRQSDAEPIPDWLDYQHVPQLRREAVERWAAVRPASLGQAARVSGIHPTDVCVLRVHLAAMARAQR